MARSDAFGWAVHYISQFLVEFRVFPRPCNRVALALVAKFFSPMHSGLLLYPLTIPPPHTTSWWVGRKDREILRTINSTIHQ